MKRPAVVGAAVTLAVLLATSGRYGYHRDELYFLQAGRHLAWGYPDQPPLTPLLARIFDTGSVTVLRLPSTVSAAVVVLVGVLMAERLGARRSGQWFAAGAIGLCGLVLGTGHLLSTATTALLGSVLISYLVLRILQGGSPRLWLLAGLVGAITFQANALVGFFLLALALCLRRPGAFVAGAIALVIGAPYLVWQAQHDWPQLTVARGIAEGHSGSSVPRALFLVLLLLQVGPWLAPVWITGLTRVLRDPVLRGYGLAFLLLTVTFVVLGGKPYYLGGFLPLLLAAGAQPLVDRLARWGPPVLLALSTPVLVFTLPVLPVSAVGAVLAVNPDSGETIGWASFAQQVAEQHPDVVVTQNYGEAGALQRYTSLRVYSGHNGYGLWAIPPGSVPALLVGFDDAPSYCTSSTVVGKVRMPVDDDEDGTVLRTCSPAAPWEQLWPQVRHLG